MPDDDTTYVWMMGPSSVTDMYTLENHGITAGTINYVHIFTRAKTNTYPIAGTGYYRILANYSGTTVRQYCTLTTDYDTFNYLLTSTPTGAGWTWTALDALKIGFDASSPQTTYPASLTLRPNGDTSEAWSLYGESDSYKCVDDVTPDENTTYLYTSSTVTTVMTLENCLGTETGTINNITTTFRAKKNTDSPVNFPYSSLILGASTLYGPQKTVTKEWADYSDAFTTKPGGGAWLWTDINNTSIGINNNHHSLSVRCTQLYAVVNYTANPYPHVRTTAMYAVVNYTPSSSTCYLSKPHTYTYTNNRDVRKINLWNTERKVYDLARSSKTLTMTGKEYQRPGSTPTTVLNCVCMMKDNGTFVTISGIGDTLVDTDWLISDFSYGKNTENPYIYDWTLTMERYENG